MLLSLGRHLSANIDGRRLWTRSSSGTWSSSSSDVWRPARCNIYSVNDDRRRRQRCRHDSHIYWR